MTSLLKVLPPPPGTHAITVNTFAASFNTFIDACVAEMSSTATENTLDHSALRSSKSPLGSPQKLAKLARESDTNFIAKTLFEMGHDLARSWRASRCARFAALTCC